MEYFGLFQKLHWSVRFNFFNFLNQKGYTKSSCFGRLIVLLILYDLIVNFESFAYSFFILTFIVLILESGEILVRHDLESSLLRFQLNVVLFPGVQYQLEDPMESLVTSLLFTLIWFGLSMPSQMLLEIATGSETFWTKITLKRLVSCVDTLVHH